MVIAAMFKKGYKQTEVGVIPEEWDIESIEDLTPQGKKYGIVDGPFGSNLKTIHYRKSGIPIITSGYVTDGKFFASEYLYVDIEKFRQERRSAVTGGDIVMAKIGERCGASAILPREHPEGILSGNALKISIDENKFSTELIAQILWRHHEVGNFELLRTTGAQPAISMANLKKYKIPLPATKQEQTIIATVLSDADALIEGLKKLIAKKKAIKQGTMQQLLTGKKRLPGFSGEWQVKTLGALSDISKGTQLRTNAVNTTGKFAHLNGGINPSGYTDRSNISANTIAISEGGNSCGYVQFMVEPYWCGGHCYSVIPNGINNCFLYHALKWQQFAIMALRVGSGLPNVQKSAVLAFKLRYPVSDAEQAAIATTLSDMDTEIKSLEQKRDKYTLLKQGMMQQLLTGKIRIYANN